MKRRQFAVEIMLATEDGAVTAEIVKSAVLYMLERAARMPPDQRIDWSEVSVDVQDYAGVGTPQENGHARRAA